MVKVLVENDKASVVELGMNKGGKIAEHTDGPYLTHAVTPFDHKSTTGGKFVKRRTKVSAATCVVIGGDGARCNP